MTTLRQRMVEELQRRNYSPATIRGYVLAVKQFAEYFGKPPDRLGATQVQGFQWFLVQERKLAPGRVEMRMSALRFFFKKVLNRRHSHLDRAGCEFSLLQQEPLESLHLRRSQSIRRLTEILCE